MNTDLELDGWRQQWQRQPVRGVAELKESVMRETRRTKLMMLAPVAVTVVIGGWAILQAWQAPTPAAIVLAVGVWAYIVLAWVGSLWLARGTWRPRAETTAEFLALAIRRCESAVRAVPFAIALYVFEIAFMVLWASGTGTSTVGEVLRSPSMISIGWVGGPLFVAAALWYAGHKRAELQCLLELRRQLGQD
jgi:hypothetical protein